MASGFRNHKNKKQETTEIGWTDCKKVLKGSTAVTRELADNGHHSVTKLTAPQIQSLVRQQTDNLQHDPRTDIDMRVGEGGRANSGGVLRKPPELTGSPLLNRHLPVKAQPWAGRKYRYRESPTKGTDR
ncbi:hypothetical protein AAG570_013026 [Ranatra chinensis]|uniref:Uncharacterized protein n=1 Tax=Ranatra chinensis TaxID=642074 RepID=A0ABD0YU65_9HEMI